VEHVETEETTMKKLVVGGVSAFAVAVVGTGVYLAVPASGSTEATVSTASEQVAGQVAGDKADGQKDGRKGGRKALIKRLSGRGVHGEATVRTKKGFVQISWQRGVLTGKSGSNLTVRSLDGTVWTWKTDGKTRVHKGGKKVALSNLATNDYVVLAGTLGSGNSHSAKAVVVPKKVPAKATQSPAPSHS
jgi:hypothetical protein